jgi:hypothetical protein
MIKIVNCPSENAASCPGVWDKLEQTGDRMIRFCPNCFRTVYHCETKAEADGRMDLDQRVALAEAAKP